MTGIVSRGAVRLAVAREIPIRAVNCKTAQVTIDRPYHPILVLYNDREKQSVTCLEQMTLCFSFTRQLR